MKSLLSTKFALLLGLIVFWPAPCWTMQEKAAPGSMPTSSVCAAQPVDPRVTARAFYVAVKGNDSNPGTIDSPWRTVQHSADSVEAGATVYIRGGVYNESVDIDVSGSATAGPITFQSYPGETAILDGAGLTPPTTDIGD